jgi:hypothetical protein
MFAPGGDAGELQNSFLRPAVLTRINIGDLGVLF